MRLAIFAAAIALAACATTNITGFTDPDYKNKSYKNLVVVTPNLNLEYASLLQGKVCHAITLKKAACARGLDLFPPTRTYDTSGIVRVLSDNQIDGYLLVIYGGGATQTQQIGSLSYGSASVYGNTVSAYSSTTPIMSFARSDGYSAVLIDTATYNKAWIGGVRTHASGLANITDDVFTSSLATKLAAELAASGHL